MASVADCLAEAPLAEHTGVVLKDLDRVPFVVHHLCSSTEKVVLRFFRQNGIPCHVVAELWSFENVKSFVLENVGVAIVLRITVMEELRTGLWSRSACLS
jgi:DNA-binding transcriptional LysR family regulator